MAQAAGRAENQPVRVTSALKKGPRATSAKTAETSRRSETSGTSCQTSQEPARAEANQSSGKTPEGQARAERAKLLVTPSTSGAKEFEDG